MKTFFKNLFLGIPLALGAMLTVAAVSLIIQRDDIKDLTGGVMCGLVGIPILFATLSAILKGPKDVI
jgi:ethanolamine transporter EutH